jgi:hypothetical protein
MKALRIVADRAGTALAPLPLPVLHRAGGWIDPLPYRQQAAGEQPMPQQNLAQSTGLSTILLSDGTHAGLYRTGPAVLDFVIAGALDLGGTTLLPGDVVLGGAAACEARATGNCRLVRLGVAADWPGDDAVQQEPGTIVPRPRAEPNLRRMDTRADGRTWSASFANLFPAPADQWSPVTPVKGYRFLCFPDQALIDWHPEVVNNLAIFLSGDMEIEIGGGGGPKIDHFLAGDVLLAADRTGEGHIDRMHGIIHLALIVLADEHLWPI